MKNSFIKSYSFTYSSKSKHYKEWKIILIEKLSFFRLFIMSAESYSPYFAITLVCNILTLACAIYQLDLVIIWIWTLSYFFFIITKNLFKEIQHIDFNINIVLITIAIIATKLFLFCFFGKMATESFIEMADCLFDANWQSLPIHLQKYFILMIDNVQKPLFYNGYGIVILNLETFTKVRHTFFITFFCIFESNKK